MEDYGTQLSELSITKAQAQAQIREGNSVSILGKPAFALGLAMLVLVSSVAGAGEAQPPIPIRIGWQMPAVTQAGIVQVLKRTDVLARHGLDPSLVPFSYGTPEIEAAFAGELDALFAGDQPVINLLARGGKWKIVGRIYYDRVAVIVPPQSPIAGIEDLNGRTVASPFGSVAHREAFLEQQAAGLDPSRDVENRNLDILEIRRRVLDGGVESWGGLDAAAVWEPNASSFQLAGQTRNLTETRTLGVIAVSDEFIAQHPQATVAFLAALIRAWHFMAADPDRVMRWYNDDTQFAFEHQALLEAVRVDPNVTAKSVGEIDFQLSDQHLATLEQNAAWGVENWEDGSEIRRFIDGELLTRAEQEIASASLEDLRVILPSIRAVDSEVSSLSDSFDGLPLLLVFLFMVAVALLALELGLWLGRRTPHAAAEELARPIATVGAAVLAMMAFVIALTFGSATDRFDARKAALLDDVASIQTAYLRTSMLPEPHRTTVQSLLRDYVQARVGIVYAYGDPATLRLVEERARTLQALMWSHVEALADADRGGSRESFASALNDVFNMHTRRVVLGAYYQIPGFMWWSIIFAAGILKRAHLPSRSG